MSLDEEVLVTQSLTLHIINTMSRNMTRINELNSLDLVTKHPLGTPVPRLDSRAAAKFFRKDCLKIYFLLDLCSLFRPIKSFFAPAALLFFDGPFGPGNALFFLSPFKIS